MLHSVDNEEVHVDEICVTNTTVMYENEGGVERKIELVKHSHKKRFRYDPDNVTMEAQNFSPTDDMESMVAHQVSPLNQTVEGRSFSILFP